MNDIIKYKTIACIGDNCRFKYLSSMVQSNLINKCSKNIIITPLDIKYTDLQEKFQIIPHRCVTFGHLIEFPLLENKTISSVTNMTYDKILYFIGFPFILKDKIETILSISETSNTNLDIVLFYDNRNVLSTDLVNYDAIFKEAKQTFKNICNKIHIVSTFDSEYDIFSIDYYGRLSKYIKNNYINNLKCLRETFENFHNDYNIRVLDVCRMFYSISEDVDLYTTYIKIFDYDKIKDSNNVWNTYIINFIESCFKRDLLEFILDFYEEYIQPICFWNIISEKNTLRNNIIQEFCRYMNTQNKYFKNQNLYYDELSYKSFCNKHNIIKIFGNNIDNFFNEKLYSILKEQISFRLYKFHKGVY